MDKEFLEILSRMADEHLSNDNAAHAAQTANRLEQIISQDDKYDQTFMPAYLKEQMLNRASQPDIQTEKSVKRFSKQVELFLYGCKVTAAVAASLLIMVTTTTLQNRLPETDIPKEPFSYQSEMENIDISGSIMKHLNKGSDSITSWLQSISSTIMGGNTENK